MNCNEFRQYIPDIVHKKTDVDKMADLVEHVRGCKDCYDELEINYVINYGLDDTHMHDEFIDFSEELKKDIDRMDRIAHIHRRWDSLRILIRIATYAAVLGTLVYVIFKFWI